MGKNRGNTYHDEEDFPYKHCQLAAKIVKTFLNIPYARAPWPRMNQTSNDKGLSTPSIAFGTLTKASKPKRHAKTKKIKRT